MKSIFCSIVICTFMQATMTAEHAVSDNLKFEQAQAYLRESLLYMHKNEPDKARDALSFARNLHPSEEGLFGCICKIAAYQIADMQLPPIERRQFTYPTLDALLSELNSTTMSMVVYHQLITKCDASIMRPSSRDNVNFYVVSEFAQTVPYLWGNYRLLVENIVNHSLKQIDSKRRTEEQGYMLQLYNASGEERADMHDELAELYLAWDKEYLAYAELTLALEIPGISDASRQELQKKLTNIMDEKNYLMHKAKLL